VSRRAPVLFDTTSGTAPPATCGRSDDSLAHDPSAGVAAADVVDVALGTDVALGSELGAGVVALGTDVGAEVVAPVGAPGTPLVAAVRDGDAVAAAGGVVMGAPVARTVSGPHAASKSIRTLSVARRISDTVRGATAYSREC